MKDAMQDIFDTLFIVVEKLESVNIPYMLSGSVAATLYAEPRFTNDIDIVIHTYRDKKSELLDLFKETFYITEQAIDDAFNGVGMFNIIHQKSVTKCDLILLKQDEFSQNTFLRSVDHTIPGYKRAVRVISLEDLILQKLLWWKAFESQLQWNDLQRLVLMRKHNVDLSYLKTWAQKIGVEEGLKKLL